MSEIAATVRFDSDIQIEMKRLAEKHKRSFNSEVMWALQEYIKGEKQKMVDEQEITDKWANMMLNEAVEAMEKADIEITPENFSKYFEKNYELPFTPEEAGEWLREQEWYK